MVKKKDEIPDWVTDEIQNAKFEKPKKMKISGILQEILIKSGEKFIVIGVGVNLIKSPVLKDYLTTNLFDLTGIKITANSAASKLKRIYEDFIPIFPKFNVKNLDRNLK